MTDGAVVELDDLIWERMVEKSEMPVVVMFYSPTCAHCRTMEPYFSEMAQKYREKISFTRLNIISSQWIAERYGVRATPTFKFFCSGKPVMDFVGAVYPAVLEKKVEEVLIHGKECAEKSTEIDYEITGYG